MNIKRIMKICAPLSATLLVAPILYSISCSNDRVANPVDDGTFIKETSYKKVFIISGQSNAVGQSRTEYLKKKISSTEFEYFKAGISKAQISECISRELPGSVSFTPTTFTREYFGLEMGFADIMAKRSSEPVYIIKYAIGGTRLDKEWLDSKQNRGDLYYKMIDFIRQSMALLSNAKICGFCWMQGESDTEPYELSRYYDNTALFINYLREDLKDITCDSGFNFIDAGINKSWKNYKKLNAAKIKYSKESELNGYFSTSENGLTTGTEPIEGPDYSHYDSISELTLGRWFALKSLQLFNKNN